MKRRIPYFPTLLPLAAALALALGGCVSSGGLHPDGKLQSPDSLHDQQTLAALGVASAQWPAQDWWTGLGDPQLDALIAEALRDNPSLAVADARAREAQAQVGVANAARLPDVKAGGSLGGSRLPATAAPLGDGHYAPMKYADASFSWGPDLWGGKRAAWEAAMGQARAAQIDARAARIELSTNVARAYAQLGYAFTQLDLARAERARAAQARALTAQRVAAGIDSQLQIKQDDAALASADKGVAQAQRAIDSARSALSVLLGKGPDRGLEIARPKALAPSAVAVPDNLPIELLGHRADIVAARWRVQAAARQIKVAKTEFLPNLSIGAYAGLITLGSANLFQAPARFFAVAPSLSLPLFDGGRLRANLAGRDAQYDEAVADYNQRLVGAVDQVADDLSALKALDEEAVAQQRGLDAARQAWQLEQDRYKAGIGSYLESLTVRQQLLGAEQTMAQIKAQQVDMSMQLIQALGGGFRPGQGPDGHADDQAAITSNPSS